MTSPIAPSSAHEFASFDPLKSAVWVLDSEGKLTLLSPEGVLQEAKPPSRFRVLDIAIAGMSSLWIIGRSTAGRIHLAKWQSRAFHEYPAELLKGVKRVVGSHDGSVWLIKSCSVSKIDPDSGEEVEMVMDFEVHDFHQGPNGTLWVVGGMRRLGGFEVRCLVGGDEDWFVLPSPAAAVSISGAPDGTAWSVNAQGDVWRLNPRGGGHFRECQVFTGCTNCLFSPTARHAREISVGANGAVWILSRRAATNGYGVEWLADFKRKEIRTMPEEFGAVRIAATIHHSLSI